MTIARNIMLTFSINICFIILLILDFSISLKFAFKFYEAYVLHTYNVGKINNSNVDILLSYNLIVLQLTDI